MGSKCKLEAYASCVAQAQGACAENAIDRFSNLSDEVAHRILSYLTFKDLNRVGAVSKRCRQFHLSVPFVTFDSSCRPSRPTNLKQVRLMSSLDRYLFYRGDHRMQAFSISWNFFTPGAVGKFSDDHFRVIGWILNAVRCNVEELDLYLSGGMTLAWPSGVFLSQTLRSLSLRSDVVILKAPSISFCSNLHFLKLKQVRIADERFFKWISCSCKFIKELQLIYIEGIRNITVESSSLESFVGWINQSSDLLHLNISGKKLESIGLHLNDDFWVIDETTESKSSKIFAPNLKKLKWKGYLRNSQNLGKLMSLEEVEIVLNPTGNEFDTVFEFLCSLCWAKALIINEGTVKALFKEGSMSAPLDKICKLDVHCSSWRDDFVPAMVSLVRGMPNLNILYIKTCGQDIRSGFDMGYWKLQNLAFVHQLKEVTIENSHGSNEIEFARYILEHAQNLKKMVIVHDGDGKVVAGMLSRSKMISAATIVIRRRKDVLFRCPYCRCY